MKKCLVVNNINLPLSIIDSSRGFVLWLKDRAHILHEYDVDDFALKTPTKVYKAPSVIVIKQYVNYYYNRVPLTKRNVFKRDGYECVYCGNKKDLTLDHVIPTSKGGEHSWRNVVTACKKCNNTKTDLMGDDLPEEYRIAVNTIHRPHALLMMIKSVKKVPTVWRPYLFMD